MPEVSRGNGIPPRKTRMYAVKFFGVRHREREREIERDKERGRERESVIKNEREND